MNANEFRALVGAGVAQMKMQSGSTGSISFKNSFILDRVGSASICKVASCMYLRL